MQNFCCGLFLLLATGVLFSCDSKTQEKKFFDVPGYFKAQQDTIKSKYTILRKHSVYNGDSSKTISKVSEINWDKELALFIECNLNKPIYYANAQKNIAGDSTFFQDENYEIKSKSAFIKEVRIKKASGIPFMISIDLAKDNLISSTRIKLFYHTLHIPFLVDKPEAEILYSIRGEQVLKGLNQKSTFEVVGIICNRE